MADWESAREIASAIEDGDESRVCSLLDRHPEQIARNTSNGTWLHFAARRTGANSLRIAELLIDKGIDVNVVANNSTQDPPIFSAIVSDQPRMVELLLRKGANANARKLLISAIAGGGLNSLELVKLLEEYGADIHAVFPNDNTKDSMNALTAAIQWGKTDVVDYLRSKGATVPTVKRSPRKVEAIPGNRESDVIEYFDGHFGPVHSQSLVEIVPSGWPPIAIHVVPPSKDRNHITLFTTGMSSEPMTAPSGGEDFRFAELFIDLPSGWKYAEIGDPDYGWPLHWLRTMARYPHRNKTWLGGPVTTVANGEPAKPLAPNVRFTSILLLAERSFRSRDSKTVRLYRMTPIFEEERLLAIREGPPALMRRFDSQRTPFILDLNRKNVAM